MNKGVYLKLVLILLFCAFLCGCTGKYTLDINKNGTNERIIITEANSILKKNIINSMENGYSELFECFETNDYECKEKIYNENKYGQIKDYVKLLREKYISTKFKTYEEIFGIGGIIEDSETIEINSSVGIVSYANTENFSLVFLSKIFSEYHINNSNDKIILTAKNINSNIFENIDTYIFEITSSYKATSNNADNIVINNNQYSYIWNFTSDTINAANIEIELDSTKTLSQQKSKVKTFSTIIIIGVLALIIIISFVFISTKSKKNNKI